MKLLFVLCLAVGVLAWPKHPETEDETGANISKIFNSLGLPMDDEDLPPNWDAGLDFLLEEGLDQQVYDDAMKVLKQLYKFLVKKGLTAEDIESIPESELEGTSHYDECLPEQTITSLKKLEKAGVPKDIMDEFTRVTIEIINFLNCHGLRNALVSEDLIKEHFKIFSFDWVGCLTTLVAALIKCKKDVSCILSALTSLVTCLTAKGLVVPELLN